MGLFRRRRRGRHELGAAVRDIPSATPVVLVHPPAVDLPRRALAEAETVVLPTQPTGPRVELGFRDGSVASLEPDSPQARALVALAGALTRRD